MTNYYTEGAITLPDMEPEQATFIEDLFNVIAIAEGCELPPPAQWAGYAGSQRALWLALACFALADEPFTEDDFSWSFLAAINEGKLEPHLRFTARGGFDKKDQVVNQEKLYTFLTDLVSKMFGYGKETFRYLNTFVFDTYEEAKEVSGFLHNLRDLAIYHDIYVASKGDSRITDLAWSLVMDDDIFSYPTLDISPNRKTVSMYDDENFNADLMEPLLRGIMLALDVDWVLGFEWGHTASRPMAGAYGGGALAMNATETVWMDTGYFASVQGPNLLKGPDCPKCHHQDIDGGFIEVDGSSAVQRGTCNNCGAHLEMTFQYQNALVLRDSE
jgi:hypothetical protein